MNDLSQYSDNELLALYQPKQQNTQPVRQDVSFGDSALRGLKGRALGIAQLGGDALDAMGFDVSKFQQAATDVADDYAAEREQAGLKGILGEMVGDPLTYLAVGNVAKAKSIPQLMKYGAGTGAVMGAVDDVATGESRGANMLIQGAGGAFLTPVAATAGKAVGKAGDYIVNKGADAVRSVNGMVQRFVGSLDDGVAQKIAIEIDGIVTPQDAMKAATALGDDAKGYIKEGMKGGLSPKQSYLFAKAKQNDIMMTRGQISQSPKIQRIEDAAEQEILGDAAYQIANNANKSNQEALRNYAGKLGADILDAPAGTVRLDDTSVANTVASEFSEKAAQLKAPASAAYNVQTSASVPARTFDGFVDDFKRTLPQMGIDDLTEYPKLAKRIEQMQKFSKNAINQSGNIKYGALENYKKALYRSAQDAERGEKVALNRLHNQFKDKLDDIITSDLLRNPDEAAKTLRKAPALWRDYQQSIFGKDGKAALGKIVSSNMTDKDVANLFGSGLFGKGQTQAVVKQLKNTLGDESDAVKQVRGMFLNRIMNNGLENSSAPIGTKIKSNVAKFKQSNRALYDELFTPDMQKEIDDFAEIAFLMSNKVKSKTNPSNSAINFMGLQQSIYRKLPLIGEMGEAVINALQNGADEKRAIQSITQPLKRMGSDTTIISDSLRATAGGASVQLAKQLSPRTDDVQRPVNQAETYSRDLDAYSDEELLQMLEAGQQSQIEMQPMNYETSFDVPESVQKNEGLELYAYQDTPRNKSIGYGFNMQSGIARKLWQQAGVQTDFVDALKGRAAIQPWEAQALLQTSYNVARDDAKSAVPRFNNLNASQQEAVIDMSYQYGLPNLKKNHGKFLKLLNAGLTNEAITTLRKSDYARRFPNRAMKNIRLLAGS